MPFVPSFIKGLFALTTGRNASRLSINIAIALCAGLLLPALIGGTAATGLRQAEVDKEMESHLQDKLTLLTRSLADPVWNIDTAGTATIAESALLDPSVVRVTIRDPANSLILQVERPERRSGTSRSALQPIVANDAEIRVLRDEPAFVTIAFDYARYPHQLGRYFPGPYPRRKKHIRTIEVD